MTNDEAVREVGWVARRARELALSGKPGEAPPGEYVEFFRRKIALLEHIGTADALALIPTNRALLTHYEGRAVSAPNAGEQLDAIMRDLDRTTAAWAATGHGYGTPEHEAREAVFARLKAWNIERAAATSGRAHPDVAR